MIYDKAYPYEDPLCPYNSHITVLRYYGGRDFPFKSEVDPARISENSIVLSFQDDCYIP
jgi:hypothetical protein